MLDQELFRVFSDNQFETAFGQAIGDLAQFEVDHSLHVVFGQVTEDDWHLGQTIQKLWAKRLVHLVLNTFFHGFVRLVIAGTRQSKGGFVLDCVSTDVGGHDQDHVAEIDVTTEAVGQTTFLHDLQQCVEDIRVSLFDFVQ